MSGASLLTFQSMYAILYLSKHEEKGDISMSSQQEFGYIIPYINVAGKTDPSETMKIENPLLTRTLMFISEGNWAKADEYAERILDNTPENAITYLCKLMVEYKVKLAGQLFWCGDQIYNSLNYQKFIKFADKPLKIFLATEALRIIFNNTHKSEKESSTPRNEYKGVIEWVDSTFAELKKARAYYDTLTQTQGKYLNNKQYASLEILTVSTLITHRVAFSSYVAERSAIQALFEYIKEYPAELFPGEAFTVILITHSNLLLFRKDYYGACDILTLIPNHAKIAENIQYLAQIILKELSKNYKIPAKELKIYRSLAIAQMLRFPIKDQKSADLVLKALEDFQLDEKIILSSAKRLAEYRLFTENLDVILLENANRMQNSELKTECIAYAKELQDAIQKQKKKEKEIQSRIEKQHKRKHFIEFMSLIVVLVAAIVGFIDGHRTITGYGDYWEEIPTWIFVFFITLAIMCVFSLLVGRYRRIAVCVSSASAIWQNLAWLFICCATWFFDDPEWMLCIGDFLGEFFPPFFFATLGMSFFLYINYKISDR